MPNILVVDDEPGIVNLVNTYLKAEGYEVHTAADGHAALKALHAYRPEVVILDIMLPGLDGLEVLARLRRESQAYVIMLTARTEETDKIVGLSIGADDYVTKPFSPRELVARVKAALRRQQSTASSQEARNFQFRRIQIDGGSRSVRVGDRAVELTATEFDLLMALAENRPRVMTREQLLERVWGYEYYGDSRLVDVHLGHLRQKLGVEVITTVRGVGYRFEDEPA
jgi:two-component system alkaline phosphatase synthesis response regulator PhoP